ncbi:hypothetical protein [Leptospira paudalimensis]|uniref:Porin n=1 Tax=Leptospira paudalimensis TaxID=2950024 RepID=A0ABT3M463_9LEPT|nr:hypothetical protein [Leptospira paudalimensis]MCW7503170.1 hypothetical protein [Leptospira paudalimensis]
MNHFLLTDRIVRVCQLICLLVLFSNTIYAEGKGRDSQNKNEMLREELDDVEKKEDSVTIEVTHEITNDFVWRGQSFSGDYISRRDNLPYKSISEAYTYVPVARISHQSGFFFELEANIALKGRGDRDSDQRIQTYPGGNQIDLNRWTGKFLTNPNDNTNYYDPSNAVYSENCDPSLANDPFANPCAITPTQIKTYSERNGLGRTDGLFTTFAYEMETRRFGTFTVGSWWYFKKDRSSKNTWNEYFIWWEMPWLKQSLNPTIQSFKQTSANTQAGYSSHYSSFSLGHHFMKEKEVSFEWTTSFGYVWVNNPDSQKSGLNDITSSIKFFWNQIFLSFNHAHRPEIQLYDNDKIYFVNSETNRMPTNLSERDGMTADPSQLFGIRNELVRSVINQTDTTDLVQVWALNRIQSQMIPRNLFWFGIGMNQTF